MHVAQSRGGISAVIFANVEHWASRLVHETSVSVCADGVIFFLVESSVRCVPCLVIADWVDGKPHVLVCSGEVVARRNDESMLDCT